MEVTSSERRSFEAFLQKKADVSPVAAANVRNLRVWLQSF